LLMRRSRLLLLLESLSTMRVKPSPMDRPEILPATRPIIHEFTIDAALAIRLSLWIDVISILPL